MGSSEISWVDIATAVGTALSFIGILLNLSQINKVKKVSDATAEAVNQTRKEFERTLSIVELAKNNEVINQIQDYINQTKIELALLRMRELKATLIELKAVQILETSNFKETLSSYVLTLGQDITSLQKAIHNPKKLNGNGVISNLDKVSEMLSSIQAELKHKIK